MQGAKESNIEKILDNSFLSHYLQDPNVTDINFDGTKLFIKHNKKGTMRAKRHPSIEKVKRLIKMIANEQNKDITVAEPILDTEVGYLRLNAQHEAVSPDGMTFSIRVSRPRLAVGSVAESVMSKNENTGLEIEKLLSLLVKANCNIIISGSTGSGKTETQKLLVKYIDDKQSIFLIEDTRDSHIKALYPNKNIKSTRTLTSEERDKKITQRTLVKSGLRNMPNWLIVSETRGEEAADMLDAVKTNHSLITTLHAESAMEIPSRLMSMVRQEEAYSSMSDDLIGNELTKFLPVGIHLDVREEKGKGVIRGIKEIVQFTGFDGKTGAKGEYLYRYTNRYNRAEKSYEEAEIINPLNDNLLNKLEDNRLYHLIPKIFLPDANSESEEESRGKN